MSIPQHVIAPIDVILDRRLTQRQMRVLLALFSFRSKTTNTVWPSRAAIAERTGLDKATISTATTDLERLGWLEKDGEGGHSKATRYTLCVPDLGDTTVAESATAGTVAQSTTVMESTTVAESATRPVAESATRCVSRKAQHAKKISKNKPLEQTTPGGGKPAAETPAERGGEKHGPKGAEAAVDEELQAACRHTWAAYSAAFAVRYGSKPVRNASVNAKVKQFVRRIGYIESPGVAAFYVERVADSFVLRKVHDIGLLLSGAEGYRTQWAAGRAFAANTNRQEAIEASNHAVGAEWLREMQSKAEVSHA